MKKMKDNPNKGLSFLYNNFFGRLLLKPLVAWPLASNIVGWFLDKKISKVFIKSFIKKNNINMDDFINQKYTSFNDFFIRKVKEEKRPISSNLSDFLSPCDSKLTCYKIDNNLTFEVKNSIYSVNSILGNDKLSKEYFNGYLLVFRLSPDDYHRYHFIDDGKILKNYKIKGKYHTVNPIVYDKYEVFKENSREVTILKTDNFDKVIYIEVGALLVGKINNIKIKGNFKRTEEKGHFKFGGSTVILLVKKDIIKINDMIISNSKKKIETSVKYGEVIGKKLK